MKATSEQIPDSLRFESLENLGRAMAALGDQLIAHDEKSPYKAPDVRFAAFAAMSIHLASVVTLLNAITWKRTPDEVARCFEALSAPVDPDDPTVRHPIERVAQFLRGSLADQIYFSIDHLFESIAVSIAANPKDKERIRSLTSALKPVLDLAALPQPSRTRAENAIKAFGYLRNCLHNNGRHRADDFDVQLQNFDFVFKEGEVVLNISWAHFFVLIDEVFEACFDVVLSPGVVAHKTMIKDPMLDAFERGLLG